MGALQILMKDNSLRLVRACVALLRWPKGPTPAKQWTSRRRLPCAQRAPRHDPRPRPLQNGLTTAQALLFFEAAAHHWLAVRLLCLAAARASAAAAAHLRSRCPRQPATPLLPCLQVGTVFMAVVPIVYLFTQVSPMVSERKGGGRAAGLPGSSTRVAASTTAAPASRRRHVHRQPAYPPAHPPTHPPRRSARTCGRSVGGQACAAG